MKSKWVTIVGSHIGLGPFYIILCSNIC